MNVAVTSASGQLGQAIVRALIPRIGKDSIIAIARTPEKARTLGVEVRQGDYDVRQDFDKALPGVDVLLLVSGMDPPGKRIGQHRNVIQAAKRCGVRKIVYTSIIGEKGESSFDAIVSSNRQTEADIQDSGLDWAIGRNGLYIEADVEYMEQYKKDGEIANCAGEGQASYTTRDELAYAYAQLIVNDDLNGKVLNLAGEAITQAELCTYLNKSFGTSLAFRDMSPEAYLAFQQEHNGEFLGKVIAGIYTKIRHGEFAVESQYQAAAGRPHLSWDAYFAAL